MISYLLYRTASAFARILPRDVARSIAAVFAFIFFMARPGIRRNVALNYERLGVREKSTFPVFRNFSRAVTDFLRLSSMNTKGLQALCSLHGVENLDRALEAGHGVILFAPHLGPWEVAGAYLAALGYRMHTVALEHPSRRVTGFFSAKRKEWGFLDYPSGSYAAGLMRALAKGEVVVLLIDRNFSRRGKRLRFLGHDAVLPSGHALLSLRTGAPLVPCCCYYADDSRIELVIGEALPARGGSAEDIVHACLASIEGFIRAHPTQWFAFDHLWEEAPGV
jgi:lauroyl/myristoyl acyltransferase